MAETSAEEKHLKKEERKPGSKKVTAKTEEQPATKTKETAKEEVKAEAPAKPTPKKAKKEETPAIPEEKEVILPELEFGSETDDFIPIEDLPSEKIELPTELFGKFEATKVETPAPVQTPAPQIPTTPAARSKIRSTTIRATIITTILVRQTIITIRRLREKRLPAFLNNRNANRWKSLTNLKVS